MPAELIALSYSPWSEKARWVLDHHGVDYRERAYFPIFGEPLLRLRLRRLAGKVTVPTLFDRGTAVMGSFAIATHVEREIPEARRLLPRAYGPQLEDFERRAERLMAAGRVLVTHRVSLDPEARSEALPPQVPGLLRGLARPLADVGIAFLRQKYGFGTAELADCEEILVSGLELLRRDLGDRPTLLESFSFADIAMAQTLQFVVPVADSHLYLGPASRRCWTMPRLAERFADLLAWRDALYNRR